MAPVSRSRIRVWLSPTTTRSQPELAAGSTQVKQAVKRSMTGSSAVGKGAEIRAGSAQNRPDAWQTVQDERAVLGAYRMAGGVGESLSFSFVGNELDLVVVTGPDAGQLDVFVDLPVNQMEEPTLSLDLRSDKPRFGVIKPVARGLNDGLYWVEIVHTPGTAGAVAPVGIDGFVVGRKANYRVGWILGGIAIVGALLAGGYILRQCRSED